MELQSMATAAALDDAAALGGGEGMATTPIMQAEGSVGERHAISF
jgi:hypothetical protein